MSEYINKSEKLASAVYLITGFFNDLEPIKWKLRTLATEMISLSILFNGENVKDKEITIAELRGFVLQISKYFSVARNAGLISADNNHLMQEELKKYSNALGYPTSFSDFLNTDSSKSRVANIEKTLIIRDKIESKSSEKSLGMFGAVSVKKNSRRSIIIGILKRKKEIMIKDVSPLINGCSEKTIQRELSNMVHSGVLKRIGEKRWSRYSLA